MKIKSILNNSALIAVDENDEEVILVGRGISFNKSPNDYADIEKVEKKFTVNNPKYEELMEVITSVPEKYLDITISIIRYAKKKLGEKLNKNIYLTLTDHIFNAIERYNDGIKLPYPMLSEMKVLYPGEYKVAYWALEYVNATLDIDLPEDECGFIAVHIITAESNSDDLSKVKKVMLVVDEISKIITSHYGSLINELELDYSRLLTHLKYFALRYLNNNQIQAETMIFSLNDEIKKSTEDCINKIDIFMKEKYDGNLSESEKMYLTIYLCRLISNN